MKSLLLLIALFCTLTLSSSSAPSVTNTTDVAKKERAVIKFSQPVHLLGATLIGQYLFVHDDEAKMRGEACTFVYRGDAELPKKLVVSFYCRPAPRGKAAKFTVRTLMTLPGQYELTEFQFGGATEAHVVTVSPHMEHVITRE